MAYTVKSIKLSKSRDSNRVKEIEAWLKKIELSNLPIIKYFQKYSVPFNRSQYYLYKNKFKIHGQKGLFDKRAEGGNKKLNLESEAFISGCVERDPAVSPTWLQRAIERRYNITLCLSGITKVLSRLKLKHEKRTKGCPQKQHLEMQHNSCGGFELIVALAYHLEWPQMVASSIHDKIKSLKRTKKFKSSNEYFDKKGRNKLGRFTSKYNQRKDIRMNRFESITKKRINKNWQSMNVCRDAITTIERKSLAILSMPVTTMNGNIRTVDSALGQELKHFAGFDYKHSSLTKYLNELKYLGTSSDLLKNTVTFWKKCWGSDIQSSSQALLCYYIDGNTKAVWSSKRVKKNKVTMLGRVMGCLEHVFIHDAFGHPIYFETYSGHGPTGEHILDLFEKIEETIEDVPGSRTSVNRVLVMDGSSNGVKALSAFASQNTYHYITPLDDNQWNERKINQIGKPMRYRYGKATLREVSIELEDSGKKGFLIETRAIKIDWDNGKTTVLLTSLPIKIAGASEIVQSYFNRWPAEELQFKSMKSTVCLHRVAGYGKQKIKDERVIEKQHHSEKMVSKMEAILKNPLSDISVHEEVIAKIIPKERILRNKSQIVNGKRKLLKKEMNQLNIYKKQIQFNDNAIKKIQKENKADFKKLKNNRREWLRLQGKETVYKVDVELDQILTFHRVSLANLYAYFIKHFLGCQKLSMLTLLHKIIHLHAIINESTDVRNVMLDYNKKDSCMMELLSKAIKKINLLNVKGPQGKVMKFSFAEDVS